MKTSFRISSHYNHPNSFYLFQQQILKEYLFFSVDKKINEKNFDKEKNKAAIMELAGSWKDLPEEDFDEIMSVAKETGKSLFPNHD